MIKELSSSDFIALLCWLYPVTLLIHLAEEYWAGVALSDSPQKMRGVNLTPARFLALTGLGTVLVLAGIIIAQQFGFPQLMLAILGIFVLINGLSHTITGALKAQYNPGIVTGLLLWIPLGALTLSRLKTTMTWQRYLAGIAIGIAIHAIVSILARGAGQARPAKMDQ